MGLKKPGDGYKIRICLCVSVCVCLLVRVAYQRIQTRSKYIFMSLAGLNNVHLSPDSKWVFTLPSESDRNVPLTLANTELSKLQRRGI